MMDRDELEALEREHQLGVDLDEFAAHLRELDEGEPLQVADLYLAYACLRGSDRAIRVFEKRFAADIGVALARLEKRGLSRDDLQQALREKLFTSASTRQPKIAEYRGRGKLRNWVRVTMLRMRIDAERATKADPARPSAAEPDLARFGGEIDPELRQLKAHYREAFRLALAGAFATLEPRERTLLRQRHVEQLSTSQLASLYDVHRATMKRWLAAARDKLFDHTKRTLQADIGRGTELDSVVRLIQSNFDVSVARLLETRNTDS